MTRVTRKWLHHDIPHWVDLNETIYFITVCCQIRGRNQLCQDRVRCQIFESVRKRTERQIWYPFIFLLMPDHLHALISFPTNGDSMRAAVQAWKSWVRKETGILWQRGFFDHRLRSDETFNEKLHYIRQNPVRAGLIEQAEDWNYIWTPQSELRSAEGKL